MPICICGHDELPHQNPAGRPYYASSCCATDSDGETPCCACERFDDAARYEYVVIREYRGKKTALFVGREADARTVYERAYLRYRSGDIALCRAHFTILKAAHFGMNRTRW